MPASGSSRKTICARGARLVNFQASTFRLGKPTRRKRCKASSRMASSHGNATPASCLPLSMAREELVFMVAGSDSPSCCGALGHVGIARGLELERQVLAAGPYDPALDEHVHPIGDDVVEQP